MHRDGPRRIRYALAAAIYLSTAGAWAGPPAAAPPAGAVATAAHLGAHLKNWGLFNDEKVRSDIEALDAWKIEQGSRGVVVAVIDTGIDATHPDLRANLWNANAAGMPDGGGQGYILPVAADAGDAGGALSVPASGAGTAGREVYGWDFVADRANPMDNRGHGTHVAGIIGAVADAKAGVSGVTHHVSIMSVKYYSAANPGSVNLANTIKSIDYAVDHGARIINYSGGGPNYSQAENDAIQRAGEHGILFVAAAGNDDADIDLPGNRYYPASYGLSNVISVAATNIDNKLLPGSDWGVKSVDLAAPGEHIYSTLPGGHYGYLSGTSQATAFVSGVAALLLSKDPALTPAQLKQLIVQSVDPVPTLKDKVRSGGKLNAYAALKSLEALHAAQPAVARTDSATAARHTVAQADTGTAAQSAVPLANTAAPHAVAQTNTAAAHPVVRANTAVAAVVPHTVTTTY